MVGISWTIVGGESGPKARPCDVVWIRSIVEQCKAAGVPVFVKQLGACWAKTAWECHEQFPYGKTDRKGGDPDEWPEDLRVREYPKPVTL